RRSRFGLGYREPALPWRWKHRRRTVADQTLELPILNQGCEPGLRRIDGNGDNIAVPIVSSYVAAMFNHANSIDPVVVNSWSITRNEIDRGRVRILDDRCVIDL